ncbi:MAG: Peptidase [Candidatus Beckwithbacteria bacterium GW2011_GWB1_47_15]|uniref:Peptidase n=1 Tax=Candidatus Beckwithbacteria bacterium GW2011_GWB1_47_15 TaxID=1618371 RepID=A0A0G1U598_9BACT|nr:MAG: peptidase [Candidatus Beckwithbacteria bacterium GW2011_GWC1_49_16]KKU35224.1 MAG: Peptidase [Candidatus Beckwithbacteria bacterium GW2011_GWA1_46_30]KKU61498.1 MAG: Peptidase [Candidatus Beckwithbacteria bacterium GW2011_GWB1_47_15]KKU71702.1 MAG: Peptidase [Candidatus Beckwithbacteria bacterium GW2011_GWA2_47_25]KKW03800.1 MAG: Peptidase [Candidatus Beckwithbacteria bacterium GW2011_GWC2_49_11]OGD48100.1 MAG: hypothetical protein A2877_00150 [Candidatus Beckwithbacteria bacterium RIF
MNGWFKRHWWWVLILLAVIGATWWVRTDKQVFLSPEAPYVLLEKPLEKYSFANLRQASFTGSEIKLERVLAEEAGYTSWMFVYDADGGKISGQVNIPKGEPPAGGRPVIVMLRGYVDQEIYEIGVGTSRVAAVLAANGFITLAPDFLGYGESDLPPNNTLQERFMRPGQVIQLIESVKSLPQADPDRVGIWGHSNGGQIALSVLEITGKDYPAVLWAPVSKPFPYSILYYTDEFDDYGRALRQVVAGFEAVYNADDYSIHRYYDWISAPTQIHQGTSDDAVPYEWSQELNDRLEALDKEVEFYTYPGADHNLLPAWDTAVSRSMEWFAARL